MPFYGIMGSTMMIQISKPRMWDSLQDKWLVCSTKSDKKQRDKNFYELEEI